ncbi:MAG: chitin-binding domain-containing protein [Pelagimonas sp.]|uniref:chitin-binding domain-containing protein n=1 Tax=Pelagimonas sp. TaxID=2073170 RepID=UPI003D6A10B3
MTFKTLLVATTLTLMPVLGYAECSGSHIQAMSCADGMVYDSTSQSCKTVSG